jgi:hypothetical protein
MNWQLLMASVRKSASLVLAGVVIVCAARAQEPSLNKDRPLLETDLHRFGYDTSRATGHLQKFVDFTDASHLAVAWLTLDDPTLAGKSWVSGRPAHLHVLVLDARTGQKVGLQAWPTSSNMVRFLGARDGKFFTCTGSVLRLFSPTLEVIRELNLPNDRACLNPSGGSGPWGIPQWGISPSRRTLLLSSPSGKGYDDMLLDVESFAVVERWTDTTRIRSISDDWLLGSCGQKQTCVRRIHEPWRPFQSTGTDGEVPDVSLSSRFINNDNLVVGSRRTAVGTVDGAQLFRVELPKKRSVEGMVTSSGGERFAVIEDRERGLTSEPLDMGAFPSNDRAVVYSIPDRHAIYSVKVKGTSPWPPWEIHTNRLALSADGALLAVIDGANLKVYRLPVSDSAQH